MRCKRLLLYSFAIFPLVGGIESARATELGESVAKLRVTTADGRVVSGSAVVIGRETIATACHVTRQAATIEVITGTERWLADAQSGSVAHDLCVLTVPGMQLPPAKVRPSATLRLGESVFAVGFEGGKSEAMPRDGVIEGLYPYDHGQVIRTSASFEFGASGGGLFDAAGNLVGVLAFKARRGDRLRFALPAEWLGPQFVARNFAPIEANAAGKAFWEHSKASQPAFLGLAILEASRRAD